MKKILFVWEEHYKLPGKAAHTEFVKYTQYEQGGETKWQDETN
jgi:hypothetical protein